MTSLSVVNDDNVTFNSVNENERENNNSYANDSYYFSKDEEGNLETVSVIFVQYL